MNKIIITGTSWGIGKAIAKNLLKQNVTVIGISRKHTIKHKNYFAISYDLNDFKNIKNILDDIIFNHKKIDAIISNAGYGVFENLENLKEKEVIEFFNVNLLAHILISKTLVSHFKKKKAGHFIFIGSEASLKGNQKSTLYSAAKHGLLGFVKSFREECNKSEIRVTIVNPGMVNSSFFKKLKFSPGKSIKNSIKLTDIAELVFFILKSNRNINYNDIYLSPIKKVINFKNN